MLRAILTATKSSVKSSVKTDDRILNYFRSNPTGTVKELAEQLTLTTRAVEKHIAALKVEGRLRRTGPVTLVTAQSTSQRFRYSHLWYMEDWQALQILD